MKIGIAVFPGSNCDRDVHHVLNNVVGIPADFIWHTKDRISGYDAMVVDPMIQGSRTVLWRGVDSGLIDGIVNGVGARARNVGGGLKRLQSGYIRSYAAWVVLGSLIVIVAMGMMGGNR